MGYALRLSFGHIQVARDQGITVGTLKHKNHGWKFQ
jgi:hypothetical protein